MSHRLIGTSISIPLHWIFNTKRTYSPCRHISKQSSIFSWKKHTCETYSPPNMSTKNKNNSLKTHIFQVEHVWKTTNSRTNLITTTHFLKRNLDLFWGDSFLQVTNSNENFRFYPRNSTQRPRVRSSWNRQKIGTEFYFTNHEGIDMIRIENMKTYRF